MLNKINNSKEVKAIAEKQKILNYAMVKFPKEGFYSISMDEIASDLMISKKTIYKLFPSKNILVSDVVDNFMEYESSEIDKILKSDANCILKFIHILELYTVVTSGISEKWQRDVMLHAPEVKKKIDKFTSDKIFGMLEKLIKQGKKEKLIQNYPTDLIIGLNLILAKKPVCT